VRERESYGDKLTENLGDLEGLVMILRVKTALDNLYIIVLYIH